MERLCMRERKNIFHVAASAILAKKYNITQTLLLYQYDTMWCNTMNRNVIDINLMYNCREYIFLKKEKPVFILNRFKN